MADADVPDADVPDADVPDADVPAAAEPTSPVFSAVLLSLRSSFSNGTICRLEDDEVELPLDGVVEGGREGREEEAAEAV